MTAGGSREPAPHRISRIETGYGTGPAGPPQEQDTMARTLKSDAVLFSTTLLLLVIGMTWVYSASEVKYGASLVMKQGMFMAFGMVGAFAAMKTDYRRLCNRRMAIWVVCVTAAVLVGVLLFGRTVGGGRRWIGWGGLGIQPSEFAKLVAVFFVATVLERRLEDQEATWAAGSYCWPPAPRSSSFRASPIDGWRSPRPRRCLC
jgi:cell division protein FtsW (lipid II flippase)